MQFLLQSMTCNRYLYAYVTLTSKSNGENAWNTKNIQDVYCLLFFYWLISSLHFYFVITESKLPCAKLKRLSKMWLNKIMKKHSAEWTEEKEMLSLGRISRYLSSTWPIVAVAHKKYTLCSSSAVNWLIFKQNIPSLKDHFHLNFIMCTKMIIFIRTVHVQLKDIIRIFTPHLFTQLHVTITSCYSKSLKLGWTTNGDIRDKARNVLIRLLRLH